MRKIKYLLALAALLLCVPALAAETPRLKIEVPGQNVKPQEEFAVTLSLHDIPSIAALGFHISYDKTCLELTGYEDAGLTGWMVGIGQGEGAVWVNEKGWSGDGSCLKLTFRVRQDAIEGTASIGITDLEAYNAKEEAVALAVTPGGLYVQGAPAKPTNPASPGTADSSQPGTPTASTPEQMNPAGQTPSEEPGTGDAAVPQPSGESPAVETESPAAENSPLPIVITVAAISQPAAAHSCCADGTAIYRISHKNAPPAGRNG